MLTALRIHARGVQYCHTHHAYTNKPRDKFISMEGQGTDEDNHECCATEHAKHTAEAVYPRTSASEDHDIPPRTTRIGNLQPDVIVEDTMSRSRGIQDTEKNSPDEDQTSLQEEKFFPSNENGRTQMSKAHHWESTWDWSKKIKLKRSVEWRLLSPGSTSNLLSVSPARNTFRSFIMSSSGGHQLFKKLHQASDFQDDAFYYKGSPIKALLREEQRGVSLCSWPPDT